MIKLLRFLGAFLGGTLFAVLLTTAASAAFTAAYRAYTAMPAAANQIEDYRFVTYHTLTVLPVLIVSFFFGCRWIWRWSRRFMPSS